MIFEFEIDSVGHSGAQSTCDGLTKFLNYNVLAHGNKIKLVVPPNPTGKDGCYIVRIKVEIEEKPYKRFNND